MTKYSLIIPVFNRPEEVKDLLVSIENQTFKDFEVIIVEDGSTNPANFTIEPFLHQFDLHYFQKENSGPGLTRNFGANKSSGAILIFLDSDCELPPEYLTKIDDFLSENEVDFFGGPDRAHESFTNIQKAINYAMTSFFTTGGIRGGEKQLEKYKPRSFNMGIKKTAFEQVGEFSKMRFGEDIDLSLRLEKHGFKSALIDKAFVYHKRRSNFKQFFKQVYNSGVARIHLSIRHPGSTKLVHLLPSTFLVGTLTLLVLSEFHYLLLTPIPIFIVTILLHSTWTNKNLMVGLLSIIASYIQLFGYGLGFLVSFFQNKILKRKPNFSFEKTLYD